MAGMGSCEKHIYTKYKKRQLSMNHYQLTSTKYRDGSTIKPRNKMQVRKYPDMTGMTKYLSPFWCLLLHVLHPTTHTIQLYNAHSQSDRWYKNNNNEMGFGCILSLPHLFWGHYYAYVSVKFKEKALVLPLDRSCCIRVEF